MRRLAAVASIPRQVGSRMPACRATLDASRETQLWTDSKVSSNTCTIVFMVDVLRPQCQEDAVRRIEADVAEVAGQLNAAHGRLVQLATELIDNDLWRGYGIKSVEHWLCWRAGLSPQRARQITAIARRHTELPVTVATLARGELSVEQVSEVVRFARANNDAEVASFAKVATVTQLRSTLSRYRFADDTETGPGSSLKSRAEAAREESAEHATEAVRTGSVAVFHDEDRFGMRVDAPVDDGALIEKALAEARDALFQAGRPDVTALDALLEVCGRSLSTVESEARRSRYRIYVHLDTGADWLKPGRRSPGWLSSGPALPQALLDKVCCDGVLQPVWETEGTPVSVGRAHRIVPERTRRLVLDRDRTCVVPGCDARHHLEVHHLVPWSRGGRTDTANLACLCPFHHDALHRGELTIAADADSPGNLVSTDGLGRNMPPVARPSPPARPDLYKNRRVSAYRHPPGERIDNRYVYFSPMSERNMRSKSHPNAPPA